MCIHVFIKYILTVSLRYPAVSGDHGSRQIRVAGAASVVIQKSNLGGGVSAVEPLGEL